MIALLQRVAEAGVDVEGETIGRIESGLLAFVCAERGDSIDEADALVKKVLAYRVFPDATGKMNRSLVDVAGGLLLVPQFTLAADTQTGTRPSFTPAAAPADAERLFNHFVARATGQHSLVETGRFGAHMRVSLVNDGPVTFWLQVKPAPVVQ
jgi:D-tyrosyl-tRNA(Tyr) deacylase